jgi:hypothetical protein
MSRYSWVETYASASADGSALTNSTTATSLIPTGAKPTLPALYFDQVGKALRILATGRVSTLVTSPGTLTLDVRFGSVIAFNGGAMTLNTTAQTNATWFLDVTLVCRSIGSSTSATVLGVGKWASRAVVGAAAAGSGGVGTLLLPDTAPVAGTGFDSTTSNPIDLFGTWSVASASNSITLHTFNVESLN